jgi:hypothetical protein
MSDKELILWAVQELLDADLLGRTHIPDYDPFNSYETRLIERLRKVAEGTDEPAYPDQREEVEALRAELAYLRARIADVNKAVGGLDA